MPRGRSSERAVPDTWFDGVVSSAAATVETSRVTAEIARRLRASPNAVADELALPKARGRARSEVKGAPWARRPAGPRRPGFPLASCLVRIVGLVFLLIAAAIIFLFLLFGGFIIN